MKRKYFVYLNTYDREEKLKQCEGVFLMTDDQVLRIEELEVTCMVCLNTLAYDERYDSRYCMNCDEWREETCHDVTCRYCSSRPKKPFGRK